MTDAEIIAIRDECLPSQGERFDDLVYGRAVAAAAYERAAQLCAKHADDYGNAHMAAELRATAFAIRLEKQGQPT